jgi:protein transport protein SEC61 subunit gamma and related proteins
LKNKLKKSKNLENTMAYQKLVSLFNQYKRVWRLLKKPSMEEFKTISKVTAIGILIIGALGFLITDLITFFIKSFYSISE